LSAGGSGIFYRALIRPGDLCFDVGANIGDYTDALVWLGARVIAIEPQPACIDELRARFSGGQFVTVVPVAVGEAECSAKLFLREHANVGSLIEDWGGYDNVDAVDVPVKTLDQLIKTYGHPKYIKIDVCPAPRPSAIFFAGSCRRGYAETHLDLLSRILPYHQYPIPQREPLLRIIRDRDRQ
jgi:FkbM family methyltransferase